MNVLPTICRHSFIAVMVSQCVAIVIAEEPRIPTPKYPNLRIVDYGSDMGSGAYRGGLAKLFSGPKGDVHVDTDGDGDTADDSVSGWKFSLTEPFNPTSDYYNSEATSAIFYGGLIGHHSNNPTARMSEGTLNENHELRDDCNMMSLQSAASQKKGNFAQAWGLWFWKKSDFLHGGDGARVFFDDESLLAVHVSRYWSDVEGGRWVVRDGDDFFVSEQTFGSAENIARRGRGTHVTWLLHPKQTRWAAYRPTEPYDLRFDVAGAKFETHEFRDVTATGFYIFKDALTNAVTSVKWHSFECFARVDKPELVSSQLEMVKLAGDDSSAVTHISSAPVSYATWRRIRSWAVSNQYCSGLDQSGYTFDRDGSPASSGTRKSSGLRDTRKSKARSLATSDTALEGRRTERYSAASPVTGITFADAAAWCNALSEYEGRTPCYCSDAATTKVLRKVRERNDPEQYDWQPEIHVKWDADGFRLPTASERNKHVHIKQHKNAGLFIARGPAQPVPISELEKTWNSVLQRNESAVAEVAKTSDVPEQPSELLASSATGRSSSTALLSDADFVKITDGRFIRNDEASVTVSDFYCQKTEVSFEQWSIVRRWALENGYVFDHHGDVGSMGWRSEDFVHSLAEPVTNISWFDAKLFCNALSEMQGREPCYYTDEAKTKVFKRSLPWRIRMMPADDYGRKSRIDMPLYTKWEADGYRLPTWAEWSIAWRAGDTSLHQGRPPAPLLERETANEWLKANSNGRTHPVGTSTPNSLGIYDLGGNVSEWLHDTPVSDYYRAENPKGNEADSLFGAAFAGGHFNSAPKGVGIRPGMNRKSAAWPWLGMRVVRCNVGVNIEKPFVPKVVLDVTTQDFDPLNGRTFRGNSRRTGYFGEKSVGAGHRGIREKSDGNPTRQRGKDASTNAAQPLADASGYDTAPAALKWKLQTGGPVRSSPVVVDGVVFVGSNDGFVYVIDAATGKRKWKYDTGGEVSGSPTIVDDRVLIGSSSGFFYALDRETGDVLWKYARDTKRPERYPVCTSPAVAHNTVFFGVGQSYNAILVGLNHRTGKKVWQLRGYKPNRGLLGPAIDGTHLYLPVNDNRLLAVDIRTELPIGDVVGHHCLASIAVDRDVIHYNTGKSITLYAPGSGSRQEFRRGTGNADPADVESLGDFRYGQSAVRTFFRRLHRQDVDGVGLSFFPQSAPAIHNGVSYFAKGDRKLYAIQLNDGKARTLWAQATPDLVRSSLSIAGDHLYYGCDDGNIYATNRTTGNPAWKYQTGGPIASSPSISGGVLFIGSDDGCVYALE